jgi:GNAT superfamily N-acetyltransferase
MTPGRGRASAATPPMPRSATCSSRGRTVRWPEEVPYDAARDLRVAWHREDFPGVDLGGHVDDARAVAMRLGAHVLAVEEAGSTVGYAQFERRGETGEITHVYVHPDHRGAGYGTALTRAAIEAAGDARDLWIIADDEGRPKNLYARLGFRPAWILTQFLRAP